MSEQYIGSHNSHLKDSIAIGQANKVDIKVFSAPSNPDPDPVFSHATLVYSKDDVEEVKGLQLILQGLRLYNGNKVHVALEEDIVTDGVTEVAAFDQCLLKSELVLLFITKNFMSREDVWKGNVALTDSLGDGKKVIPIFTEDKNKATYLKECCTLRSIRGIKYHQFKWSEDTNTAFLKNFNHIEKHRKGPGKVQARES
ncbi:uncharacterized protein [Haliotis asinina]|uniref:uncharacterized protein n=1 Tax=Haliotis asinina TaxID=109174 RepID=UPI003531AC71